MTTKNEAKLLIFSLLFTTALLSSGFWLLNKTTSNNSPSLFTLNQTQPAANYQPERISLGEKILITADTNPDKQAGVEAFSKGAFTTAIQKFQASLEKNRNDPEILIYLNNSLAANGKNIKIAVSIPIGGNLNVAKEILRGVAQAQDEINYRGGINGKRLQIVIANDDNDPSIAHHIATQFVKDSSILAVVGHNTSNASIAAAPVYQQGGLVMISPTSFAQNLSGIGTYIFRTVPSVSVMAESLSRYIVNTANKKNIAICVDAKAIDNQSYKEVFTQSIQTAGGKVNPIVCDFSAADFNPNEIISQAITSGADSLLIAPHIGRINQAIEVAQANKKRLALFSSPTLYTYQTLDSGKADVNKMVLPVPWHPTAITGNSFSQNSHNLWGGAVNWRTATAYDATMAIIVGLRQSNSRTELQTTLHNPDFAANGATGSIQFQPSGDTNGSPILVKVQPSSQSPTGYDFVPIN
jgi:branched-chain amino acid transport system substrate-binding protein